MRRPKKAKLAQYPGGFPTNGLDHSFTQRRISGNARSGKTNAPKHNIGHNGLERAVCPRPVKWNMAWLRLHDGVVVLRASRACLSTTRGPACSALVASAMDSVRCPASTSNTIGGRQSRLRTHLCPEPRANTRWRIWPVPDRVPLRRLENRPYRVLRARQLSHSTPLRFS